MVTLNSNPWGVTQHTCYGDTDENKTTTASLPQEYQEQINSAEEAEQENEETLDNDQ